MRIGVIPGAELRVTFAGTARGGAGSRGSRMRKRFTTGDRVAGVIIGLLMIIGLAFLGASAKPASNVSPARSVTSRPAATPTQAPAAPTTSGPATSAPAAVPAPPRAPSAAVATPKTTPAAPPTVQAPAQPAPVSKPPPPPPAKPGCYPLSNEGTCYEPGEYCRKADHGTSGVAGDGEAITCEDNDGWRWEPAGQPCTAASSRYAVMSLVARFAHAAARNTAT